jgi:hypothetical protein
MRRGGFGALLAFTIAILMFNGQGSPSTGSAAGSGKSAALSSATKPRPPVAAKPGSPLLEQGICKLQPPEDISCGTCEAFCPADDLRDTINAVFIPPKVPGQDASDQDLQIHWGVPAEFRANLKFVIAALPDPAHTHLSISMDRLLEATMEGAQASGYLFARASLPWQNQTFPESDDYLTRLNAADWQSEREKLPGLLIFRKATPTGLIQPTETLFIFVVGERPTGGLNKQQFQGALRIMSEIRKGTEAETNDRPLLILGPNFSGSLYSLDYLLENDPTGSTRPVIVHSGSVSSYATIRWFMNFPRARTLDFRTFLESDDYQLARFMAYAVCEQHYDTNDVAILEEDETAYGSGRTPSNPDDGPSGATGKKTTPPPWDAAPTRISENGCNVDFGKIETFFYPRDISHLRSAYQQQTQTAAASDAGQRPPRTNLPLNIEDTGNDDDSVPTYSPGQTPLSEESVLLGIVSSLHKQHAKFIILIATSDLDEIFLSQYLIRSYPEGRIVTFDDDLLLSREVDDPRFQGLLSVTSYPLFPSSRNDVAAAPLPDNSSGPPPLHEFPWDGSVGTFNAMVSLLAEPEDSRRGTNSSRNPCKPANPPDKCADLRVAAYAGYGWPALGGADANDSARSNLAPPLWLTVIGNDGYWPLAILDSQTYAQYDGAPKSVLHAINADPEPAPLKAANHKPWELLCLIFIALAAIYTYLRWSGSIFARSRIVANFAPIDDSYCSYGLFVADVMLFVVLSLLLSPWCHWSFHFGDPALGTLLGVIFALLLASSVADQVRRKSKRLAIMSFVFVPILLGAVNIPLYRDAESTRNLFFYRIIHISSGVSPLIPLLILALAGTWCAWYALSGLVLSDKRGPLLPFASDFENEPAGASGSSLAAMRFLHLSRESNHVLFKVIHPANLNPRVILLPLLALALASLVVDFCHPVRSLEGGNYNWIYFISSCAVLFILLCDLFRLVVVWIEFRAPLGALNRLPLRRGFSLLEDLKGKPLWQLGGSAFDDFFPILGREIDSLHKLKKFIAQDGNLSKAIERVDAAVLDLAEMAKPPLQAHEGKDPGSPWNRLKIWFKSVREVISSNLTAIKKRTDALKKEKAYEQRGMVWPLAKALVERARQNRTVEVLPLLEQLHESLAHACAETLLFLAPRWSTETEPPDKLPEPPEPTTEFRLMKTALPESTGHAEEFACLFYYNFTSSIFLRLRTILMSVAGMFVLLVLSFSSYPFEPKSAYHTLMTFVLILIVVLVAIVMSQMHRDPILSRITNTTPGELGWNFWFRMASFVALPLFTLLASQFPQIGSFLFFWAQPALNTFK